MGTQPLMWWMEGLVLCQVRRHAKGGICLLSANEFDLCWICWEPSRFESIYGVQESGAPFHDSHVCGWIVLVLSSLDTWHAGGVSHIYN